jgi:hypothetical protein
MCATEALSGVGYWELHQWSRSIPYLAGLGLCCCAWIIRLLHVLIASPVVLVHVHRLLPMHDMSDVVMGWIVSSLMTLQPERLHTVRKIGITEGLALVSAFALCCEGWVHYNDCSCESHYCGVCDRIGMRMGFAMRQQAIAAVYAKVLRLNSSSVADVSAGKVTPISDRLHALDCRLPVHFCLDL